MAATSHDFWLHTLSAPVWKCVHMAVYLAYGLVVAHVSLGALQAGANIALAVALGAGIALLSVLHLLAAVKERRTDKDPANAADGFIEVCEIQEIPENRARVVAVGGERVAVFRYNGKISAISNVCRHQNGPLGEGRIIDGCVTCPWHGYQYLPDSGMSPPPFTDKVPTYRTKLAGAKVFVHQCPQPPGTRIEPSQIEQVAGGMR
jgi:nitrite reductase/ring-hydroxylating ferredoxin subunit